MSSIWCSLKNCSPCIFHRFKITTNILCIPFFPCFLHPLPYYHYMQSTASLSLNHLITKRPYSTLTACWKLSACYLLRQIKTLFIVSSGKKNLNTVDTGRKLNVHKTSRTSSERLKYAQFTSCVYWENNQYWQSDTVPYMLKKYQQNALYGVLPLFLINGQFEKG